MAQFGFSVQTVIFQSFIEIGGCQISIYLLILAVELENIQFLQIFRNNEIREVWLHDIPTVLIQQDFGKTFWI